MRLTEPLTLPCGLTAPNRIAKAAMTEGLAEPGGVAGERIARCYRTWATGGAGLLITGNIMVDGRYRERPANVVVDGEQDERQRAGLSAFAEAAKSAGGLAIAQISHAGRQSPKSIAPEPVGPSAVKVKLPGGLFGTPRALTDDEILDVIDRFAITASELCRAGFDGVQVHSAHGYLLSEFLNPRVNRRDDRWGGSLDNRARLLLETVRAVRDAIGPDKALSIKLNSSDFQQGGFSFDDCLAVVGRLHGEGVDLLEISGGNYEQPRMMGLDGLEPVFDEDVRESTRAREAYFMAYAERILESARMPVMVTGGFRTRAAMNEALEAGVAMIGLARPLCVDPDAPGRLLAGSIEALPAYEKTLRLGPGWLGPHSPIDTIKAANGFGAMAFFYRNIIAIGDGEPTRERMNLLGALVRHQLQEAADAKRFG
ncbi:NADH:flavin oxidoreductase/NADH oxidase family protein [Wenzhouxiangella sp. XN79A]|uniref:NADH:flavin oxidoreductase/NADH oxidase family protein n=1 Tax=Wenzhouxiangella sp. XN79A TaxID=2724193 RepID=UPI00144AF596|nr:NADH:flavin oxidoreductase/NADH oxidase family protein [Wenzhouxiangella sp. XN79A]NKI34152.1 NADH:flavin oxidoreductase/NADH oxidase family protein [Wenzhouxiangella sp. XN79A]